MIPSRMTMTHPVAPGPDKKFIERKAESLCPADKSGIAAASLPKFTRCARTCIATPNTIVHPINMCSLMASSNGTKCFKAVLRREDTRCQVVSNSDWEVFEFESEGGGMGCSLETERTKFEGARRRCPRSKVRRSLFLMLANNSIPLIQDTFFGLWKITGKEKILSNSRTR